MATDGALDLADDRVPVLTLEEGCQPAETPLNRADVTKGFAWTAAFSFVAKIIYPLAGIVISRTLGPTILGIASLLQMTVALSEVIRDAGLSQTFLVEETTDATVQSTYTGVALFFGILPATAVLLLTPFLSGFFHQKELIWSLPIVAMCLVMNSLGTVPNAILLKKAQFKTQGFISLVAGGASLAITILLVVLGVGFPALVVQLAATSAFNLLLVLRLEPLRGVRFDPKAMGAMLNKSKNFLGANIINNVFLLCDIFVIQRLVGSTAAGLYNTAQNIAYKPAEIMLFPLGRTLMVAFSQNKGNLARLSSSYWRSVEVIILVFVPMYVAIGSNSSAIIGTLLGPKFAGGAPVLSVLCIYLAFRTFGNISGNALVPVGRHHWTIYPWIAAISVTAGGVALGAGHPTLMGIVWSFTAGAIVVYASIVGMAVFSMPPDAVHRKKLLLVTISTAITVVVIELVRFLPFGSLVELATTLLLVPVIHLVSIGFALERRPAAYLSTSGLRLLWNSL